MAAIDLLITFLMAFIKLLILSELAWALGFLALGFFLCGCRLFVCRLNSCALGVLWAHVFVPDYQCIGFSGRASSMAGALTELKSSV